MHLKGLVSLAFELNGSFGSNMQFLDLFVNFIKWPQPTIKSQQNEQFYQS